MHLEIVNVVGSGSLGRELDLEAVCSKLRGERINVDLNEEAPYMLFIILEEDTPKITLFRSGAYHIPGTASKNELKAQGERLITTFTELGIIESNDIQLPTTQNIVAKYDLEMEINLSKLAVHLGLENIEYEPEQFPGLIYRPTSDGGVVMVFSSGKGIITGWTTKEDIKSTYSSFKSKLSKM